MQMHISIYDVLFKVRILYESINRILSISCLSQCKSHLIFILEKGTDVDTWTYEELVEVVNEFKANYAPM